MVKYQKTKTKLSQENLLSTTNFYSWWMLFPAQEIVVMDKEKGGGRNNPTYQGLRGRGEPVLGGVHERHVSTPSCTWSSVLWFSGALDFEHIEEQAEGIFGGRKVYFQFLFCRWF